MVCTLTRLVLLLTAELNFSSLTAIFSRRYIRRYPGSILLTQINTTRVQDSKTRAHSHRFKFGYVKILLFVSILNIEWFTWRRHKSNNMVWHTDPRNIWANVLQIWEICKTFIFINMNVRCTVTYFFYSHNLLYVICRVCNDCICSTSTGSWLFVLFFC
jgi:hypothetical protein